MATRREALMFVLGTMAGGFAGGGLGISAQAANGGKVLLGVDGDGAETPDAESFRGFKGIWNGEKIYEMSREGIVLNQFVYLPLEGIVFAVRSSPDDHEPWDVKVRITTEEIISALQSW